MCYIGFHHGKELQCLQIAERIKLAGYHDTTIPFIKSSAGLDWIGATQAKEGVRAKV